MISVPRYVFFNGPKDVGKSSIAKGLCTILSTQISSDVRGFIEPARMSLLSTFYPDELFSLSSMNLNDQATKDLILPVTRADGKAITIRNWLVEYYKFLAALHGPDVLGQLALRRCIQDESFYSHFFFDGCRVREELDPFLRHAAHQVCLVHVYRGERTFEGVESYGAYLLDAPCRHIMLHNNGVIEDAVLQLVSEFGATPQIEPPVPLQSL